MKVFLGGTCGENHWREAIVVPGLIDRGIGKEQIFNPVVEPWDSEAQVRENAAKSDPDYLLLFVLASPDPNKEDVTEASFYSGVEATICAFVAPERTMVMIDTTGVTLSTVSSINKAAEDWQDIAPHMPIFRNYEQLLPALAARLREKQ